MMGQRRRRLTSIDLTIALSLMLAGFLAFPVCFHHDIKRWRSWCNVFACLMRMWSQQIVGLILVDVSLAQNTDDLWCRHAPCTPPDTCMADRRGKYSETWHALCSVFFLWPKECNEADIIFHMWQQIGDIETLLGGCWGCIRNGGPNLTGDRP